MKNKSRKRRKQKKILIHQKSKKYKLKQKVKYCFSSNPVDDVFKKMIILNVWLESIKISYIAFMNIIMRDGIYK